MSLFICVLLIFQSVLFTGVVTSPNFPNDYPHNLEENYTIEVEQGQVLLLAFTAFNIDSENDDTSYKLDYNRGDNEYLDSVLCPSDHLTITDSDGIILMEESCGHILPDRITSRTSKVNLTFHTDDRDVEIAYASNRYLSTRAGWSLIWSSVTPGLKALLETSAYDCLLDDINLLLQIAAMPPPTAPVQLQIQMTPNANMNLMQLVTSVVVAQIH